MSVEVSGEVREALARWPLPDGVDDADMTLVEMAQALNTSVNTVTRWIADGMPVVQVGGQGKPYVLRLSHCYAWRRAREAQADQRMAHNRRAIQQMQATLLGLDLDDQGAQMTGKQRRELAEADVAWSRAAHMRRQLVQLDEVVDLIESIFVTVRNAIEGIPDQLERELSLKPVEVQKVARISEDLLRKLAERIEEAELRERDVPEVEVQRRWTM